MHVALNIVLAKAQDLTKSTLVEEVKALLELSGINNYELHEIKPYILKLEVDKHVLSSLLDNLCRSAFIKRIECPDLDLALEFGREFVCKPRPLYKVDTASAPLEAVISRLLINLARVKQGARVLDPFSGVGGILFEAALVGAYVIGQDIGQLYLKALRRNIPVLSDTILADSSHGIAIREESIDAIVSDPPYSKLSVVDKDLDHIYYTAVKECARVLKTGCYLSWTCIASIELEDLVEEAGLEVIHVGFQLVHRSLTRKIVVARKI